MTAKHDLTKMLTSRDRSTEVPRELMGGQGPMH